MSTIGYDFAAADPNFLDSASKRWGIKTTLNVNLIVCTLSIAGSLVMIVPFLLSKQLRKIRHRLILGMAVNDLLQAASVLVPSAWSMYHGSIPTNSPGCNADSFFYLTFVVAGCFWTLAIAITTYITLVQPMSRIADYMHRPRAIYIVWIVIWLTCVLNAGIGTALNVSVDGGGYCFFPIVAPYLYGNLVLFVPRAGTFAIIILIYVRLYIFFRHQASSHYKQESGLHESSFHVQLPSPASELDLPMPEDRLHSPLNEGRPSSTSSNRLSSLVGATSRKSQVQSPAMLRQKLAEYQMTEKFSRKNSDDSSTLVSARRRFPGWAGRRRTQQSVLEKETFERKASVGMEPSLLEPENRVRIEKNAAPILQDSAEILNSPHGFEEQLFLLNIDGTRQQGSQSTATLQDDVQFLSAGSSACTAVNENGHHIVAKSSGFPQASPLRGIVSMDDAVSPGTSSMLTVTSRQERTDFPGLMVATEAEGSKTDAPIMGLWEALASVDPVDSDDAGIAETYTERGRRLSASEENRRVSYLMLLYPLAYGVILAVSMSRLAVTLATKASPSPWLQMLNKVFVLGTGVVDACIYTIIEWRFRASSRTAAKARDDAEEMRFSRST